MESNQYHPRRRTQPGCIQCSEARCTGDQKRCHPMVETGWKRCQDGFCGSFLGRPRGRMVMSSPSRRATRNFQVSSPRGTPRVTDCRTPRNSSSSISSFTPASQFRGRSTGHARSQRRSADLPLRLTHRLLQGQCSARLTSFARRALASTYRQTLRKCTSSCTGKLLKRPWYNDPSPAVWVWACQRWVCVTVTHCIHVDRSVRWPACTTRCQWFGIRHYARRSGASGRPSDSASTRSNATQSSASWNRGRRITRLFKT